MSNALFSCTASPKPEFSELNILLNDFNLHVHARNLLVFYLLEHLSLDRFNEQLSSVWAILYCTELCQQDWQMLNTALEDLIRLSQSLTVGLQLFSLQ